MTDKEWAKVHSFVLVSETNQGKVGKTMTKREMYEAKTEEFLQPVVDEHGFELVDVEYVKEATGICVLTLIRRAESQWMTAR